MQWGKRLEDTGSDWQVDFGEDNISCLISSKDAGLNNENIGGNLSDEFIILLLKKELNSSAECIAGGICWDGVDRCKILSMECQRDLVFKQLSNKDEK